MDGTTIIALILFVILGLLLALLVLPIIALVRSRQVPRLSQRIQQLEDEWQHLHAGADTGKRAPPTSVPSPEAAGPESLSRRIQRLEDEWQRLKGAGLPPEMPAPAALAPALPRERPAAGAPIPEVLPAEAPPAPRPVPFFENPETHRLEEWIGRRGLGWAAVALLLFAVAFFLKYAFENNWIGPLGRVSIGLIIGASLCLAGWQCDRRGWRRFGQMLTGGGVAVLYLATFGAFAYYHLLPRQAAAVFLVILIAETAALAIRYDAPAIATMAVIGGLLNPILLSTGIDEYRSLFTYLFLLNAGVIGLALVRSWPFVSTVALLGTQLLFWLWYEEHYHPEKRPAAIAFLAVIFVLYLVHPLQRLASTEPGWLHNLLRRRASLEDLVRLVLNALLFAWAAYVLLDADYHRWMGTLAVGMAILYTARSWLVLHFRPGHVRHILVSTAVGLAFLAMVFPLQAEAAWIGVGWAVLGLALWGFGLRIQADAVRIYGAFWLILAAGRLVLVDMPFAARPPFIPIFNKFALPGLVIAACVTAASVLSRRYHPVREGPERLVQLLAGLAGVGLIWLVLSVDTYQFFMAQIGRSALEAQTLRRLAQVGLSVLWAVYAAVVLTVGFRLPSRPLRWTALGLFAVTLAKVILLDLAGLPGFYRVTAFFVLSVMMGAGAWGYQKIEAAERPARRLTVSTSEASDEAG